VHHGMDQVRQKKKYKIVHLALLRRKLLNGGPVVRGIKRGRVLGTRKARGGRWIVTGALKKTCTKKKNATLKKKGRLWRV